jgi:hypothetical protein
MMRFTVTLDLEEMRALVRLAKLEKRDHRTQAAWLIRCQLIAMGELEKTGSDGEESEETKSE